MAKPRIFAAAGLATLTLLTAGCATSTGSLNTGATADATRGDTFPTRANGGIAEIDPNTDLCTVTPPITGATGRDGRPCPERQNGGEWPGSRP